MGRPLQKKFFGDPARPGSQIVLNSAWLPGESAAINDCYIVKQVGTGRYLVTDGTKSGVVRLVAAAPAKAGEGQLVVNKFGGGTEAVKVIHNRTIKTWSGASFAWSLAAAAKTGEVTMRFAAADVPGATLAISNPQVGTATTITVTNAIGTVKSRQWLLDGVAITGATNATYTPVAGDATKTLSVNVVLETANGATATSTSPGRVVAAA